jgi:hypothetical protein
MTASVSVLKKKSATQHWDEHPYPRDEQARSFDETGATGESPWALRLGRRILANSMQFDSANRLDGIAGRNV